MPDIDDVVGWSAYVVVAALAIALLVGVGYLLVSGITEDMAKDRCGHLGGKVEHYDPTLKSLWRCVGARTEGE